MRHTQAWIDNLSNNLSKAQQFFNPKVWSADHNSIWQNALSGFKADQISVAFQEYFARGKHMPKPAEIITIIRELYPRQTDRQRNDQREHEENAKQDGKTFCPIIANAWLQFNQLQSKQRIPVSKEIPHIEMTDDQAILICNYEARRMNAPDAISETFWIFDVWKMPKPKRTVEEQLAALLAPKQPKSSFGQTPDYSPILREHAA